MPVGAWRLGLLPCWNNAEAVYSGQTQYRAQELDREIASLSSSTPRLSSAEHATLARRSSRQFTVQGHAAGALIGDYSAITIRANGIIPLWVIHSLRTKGYAIGTWTGPSTAARAHSSPGARACRLASTPASAVRRTTRTDWWRHLPRLPARPSVSRLAVIGAYGIGLVALIGVVGAWILSRSVVRPVRRLAEASGRLAEGEAGVTVTPSGPRELRDLACAFNDMNAKLAKAQETEQAFLLSVSHELKTPLTSIRGYAEALDDDALPAAEAAAVIGTESARLERLVGDLLDSARMRKSAFTVHSETVDLAEVAQEVARRHEATARDAGLALHLELASDSLATADHDRVLQVVSNLVENAVRCTPAPGSVTISTAPGLVSVADTGRGLTSDDLPRAFERFYLYSRYGNDRPVGTGLGLAIVKELTEAMDGRRARLERGRRGTAFFVELPIAERPQDVAEPPSGEVDVAPVDSDAEPPAADPPTVDLEPAGDVQ